MSRHSIDSGPVLNISDAASLISQEKGEKKTRHLPGEAGIWVFVFGDLIIFSLFFITFLVYQGQNSELFVTSQQKLNISLGILNTAILLTSSWFVATAVSCARKRPGKSTPVLLILAVLCGLAFGVVKFFEYREKVLSGITLNTNDFFMYYYMFTGIHLLHVIVGMVVLALLAAFSWKNEFTPKVIRNIESGASFWHVVDLLWIVLFALLYMVK